MKQADKIAERLNIFTGVQKPPEVTVIRLKSAYPQEERFNRYVKRSFDVVFSCLVLLFILSWLYPLIALLIRLDSRGPVIFKQHRSGRDNKSFWCYKFRSMRVNDDSHHKQASRNDDRITGLGRFLRRTSLDEFPQFINVLIGNMSVVGPRPHMLKHTEQYRYVIKNYMVRHYSKPGITGWAQINGYRGETLQTDAMEKRVEHDIWYLENWSVYLDIKIILRTVSQVLRGHINAY
ncbi:exopolysaccharide biosynthesis polyprenyl glycosylphosphotransferase [Pedobacter sp. MR2016-24]|uniref:exopolysaccharide biosynthesis polyprenyl glycosylphosphotransferase n=1 Tax=Pedobacter sp. MR2016-24 TaxID=2994466 RepID=UPI002245A3FB|nr:exopolysaccharide biosynthesis polyprenyl glycosylphosphotransferase [Pedobacter sp. MR2016-24]MCX2485229.1 exopolysaccharide biosynthesis polyprenyl glycosylphosphotransferase [Pedobacter sp. MR2016-24]